MDSYIDVESVEVEVVHARYSWGQEAEMVERQDGLEKVSTKSDLVYVRPSRSSSRRVPNTDKFSRTESDDSRFSKDFNGDTPSKAQSSSNPNLQVWDKYVQFPENREAIFECNQCLMLEFFVIHWI